MRRLAHFTTLTFGLMLLLPLAALPAHSAMPGALVLPPTLRHDHPSSDGI